MKALKITGIVLTSLIATCFLAYGELYLADFRVYRFPSISMQPTIQKDEVVFGRLSEGYRDRLQRFDLAIFYPPTQPSEIFLKRIIGLSDEHITIDANGVRINGVPISLPPSVSATGLGTKPCDFVIPHDAVFVLGDNTANSFDSRYFGPIQKKSIIGHILLKR